MSAEIDWDQFSPWVSAPLDWVTPSDWVKVHASVNADGFGSVGHGGYELEARCKKCGTLKAVIREPGDPWQMMKSTCEHIPQGPSLEAVSKAARKRRTPFGKAPSVRV